MEEVKERNQGKNPGRAICEANTVIRILYGRKGKGVKKRIQNWFKADHQTPSTTGPKTLSNSMSRADKILRLQNVAAKKNSLSGLG